jgi:SAM-dependent methyltransferase
MTPEPAPMRRHSAALSTASSVRAIKNRSSLVPPQQSASGFGENSPPAPAGGGTFPVRARAGDAAAGMGAALVPHRSGCDIPAEFPDLTQNATQHMTQITARHLGPEAARNWNRRVREGFIDKYLAGEAVLDIGYRGSDPQSQPIIEKAIGIDLGYPGYDGKTLPFPVESQDAVFASHVLEHVEDWAGALGDWYRVLKTGGFLVIAVPHRDLYERKSTLPSRFNLDHKRFYTPASLLAEIEHALPVAGWRIRSLRDIDDGFDYAIPPERHASGCYEIELVVQKIRVPDYADALRPAPALIEFVGFCAGLVRQAVHAGRHGRSAELKQLQDVLCLLPLPPFAVLKQELLRMEQAADGSPAVLRELRVVLEPVIARQPFDSDRYLAMYPDVARAVRTDPSLTARLHFAWHGYFEGRSTGVPDARFG